MGAHTQTGVAACFSVDEYDDDLIRKHEKTRPDKEDDRTRHLLAIGAQTGPVFLTYRRRRRSMRVVQRTVADAPLFDFVAVDGVRHEVWHVHVQRRAGLDRGISAPCRRSTSLMAITVPPVRPGRARRFQRRRWRVGPGAGRGLPGQSDAGAALQPRRARPQRVECAGVPGCRALAWRAPRRRARLACRARPGGHPPGRRLVHSDLRRRPRRSTWTCSSARC